MRHRDLRDGAVAARPIPRAAAAPLAIAILLLHGVVSPTPVNAQDIVLSEAEERGKYVYETGKSRSRRIITADLQRGEPPVPAEILPCKNCHGADGRGAEDYTDVAPLNINWYAMVQSGPHAHSKRSHAAFDEASVARSIVDGLDPDGNALDPAMPRYNISDDDMADLIAYLKVMDSQSDPGITSTSVRLGTVLPMEGQHAGLGNAMRDVIEAYFSTINATGGVHGRKLELAVGPWGDTDDPAIWAARDLVNSEQVFALISGYVPEYDAEFAALADEKKIPLVGPYTALPPREDDSHGHEHEQDDKTHYSFYALAGLAHQAEVLVEAAAADHGAGTTRLAIVHPQVASINELARAAEARAETLDFKSVEVSGYAYGRFDSAATVATLRASAVDVVVFLGSAEEMVEFGSAAANTRWLPYFMAPGLLAERGVFGLPKSLSGRVLLAYASLPTDFTAEGTAEFEKLHDEFGIDYAYSIAQISAYTAARIMVEGLQRADRNLSREQLVSAMESMDGFRPGLVPPVSYGPDRRVGTLGGHIVRADLVNGQFEENTQWIALDDATRD
jgi:ABC-type branched-subunit amino acid transport system substrate-binding protein